MQQRVAVDSPEPGADKQTVATIAFMEAAEGTERRIRVGVMQKCDDCKGSGKTRKTMIQKCGVCGGAGQVQGSPGGGLFGTVIMTCRSCRGSGEVMKDPCGGCGGLGIKQGVRDTKVAFPAGTDNGMVMRVDGAGDDGIRNGPPGDLYIQVRVKEDPYFHREGRNLHVVAPISIAQAALGGTVKVRTVDGEDEVAVPAGTQSDDTATMRGRALPSLNSPRRGDQRVHFKVVIPTKLSDRQRDLLEELAALDGGKVSRPGDHGGASLLNKFQTFLKNTISGSS
jgi:molecular chaperone DnaJ